VKVAVVWDVLVKVAVVWDVLVKVVVVVWMCLRRLLLSACACKGCCCLDVLVKVAVVWMCL
jgi:hypothetical protein